MRRTRTTWAVLLVLPFCFLCVVPSTAQEVRYPIPAYEGEDLAALREWEKTWVGKKIDATNVDQVADFLPEGWVKIMKETETWRTEGLFFEIAPYKQWNPTPGFIEATKKHAPVAREKGYAGKDNDELVTYTTEAGFPFPDPKTGLEVAWNMHFQIESETWKTLMDKDRVRVMDIKTTTNRTSQAGVTGMWMAARTETEPKPLLPKKKNPRNIRWAYHRAHFHPATIKGNKLMTVRYNAHDKPDDSWNWLSQFKRIRRYVATQKMDTIDGTDSAYEDNQKYNNKLQYQTYKLLGRKDILVCRHDEQSNWTHTDTCAFWFGMKRERIKSYVVEATPKDPKHVYSKRIWYVDPEYMLISWREAYDRLGKYWRLREFVQMPWPNPYGGDGEWLVHVAGNSSDMQRIHGTSSDYAVLELGLDLDPGMYTLRGLRKGAY
jgi:hypothetical protein